jgi:beta-lactamase class A
MPSASTIKVLISVALWEAVAAGAIDASTRVPAGEMTLGDPEGLVPGFDPATELALADLDLLMLSVSDNDATNAIIDRVGMDAVNAVGARLGLTKTVLRRRMLDLAAAAAGRDNTTCAADLAALMAALGARAGIPPEVAARVLHGLGRSQHRDIIPRYLPQGVTSVACKQGDIASVRHDAALIADGARLTALAVMSRPAAAPDGLARLAASVYAQAE